LKRLQEGRKDMPDLPVRLISDEQGNAIKPLQMQHTNFAKVGKMMAVPGNILLDRSGKVVWTHYATVAMDRPDPKEVLAQVRAL
jgi:peroxiredoxin